MIGYIAGTVTAVSDQYVIVDVNGVGYRLILPEKMYSSLAQVGSKIKVFTHFLMNPRDGAVTLYGFGSPEELRFFELLTTVSGVGPKSAQAILSKADLQSLQLGIVKEDDSYLSKIAGVGSKTAQRLILELKNKVMHAGVTMSDAHDLTTESEAMDALMMLGYTRYQALDALKNVPTTIETTEDKITEALKVLSKR